jgi:rhodanese-related sulfurtransferase
MLVIQPTGNGINKVQRMKLKPDRARIAIVAILIVVVFSVALIVLSRGGDDNPTTAISPGIISPETYVSAFVDAGRDHFLLDVRTPEEFDEGHIAGAVNIPVQILDQYLSSVPQDRDVVLYCRTGNRSQVAMEILNQAGYQNVYDIEGGTVNWVAQSRPLE